MRPFPDSLAQIKAEIERTGRDGSRLAIGAWRCQRRGL